MTDAPPSAAATGGPDPFAHCAAIAARNGSPLWLAGQTLPPPKRRFLAAAYASMRLIDDGVDEDFLRLAPAARDAARPAVLQRLNAWRAAVDAAARGDAPPDGAEEAPVLRALGEVLPRSDLGVGHWHALLRAMERDVEERPVADWDDFFDYCDGATVAPAAVFIYILASRAEDGRFRWELPEPPAYFAADIAVFCYLVHIARDLAADADGDPQLLTIPRNALAELSLSPSGVKAAVRRGDARTVARVVRALSARAGEHGARAERRIAELAGRIGRGQSDILNALCGAYEVVHARIMADPSAVLHDPGGLRQLQRTAFARLHPRGR